MRTLVDTGTAFVLVVLALAAQTTIFSWGPATPDLVLAVVLAYGLTRGSLSGTLVGFFGGLGAGLLNGNMVGLAALLMAIAGFIVGFFARTVRTEGMSLLLITVAITCLSYQLLFGAFMFLFGYPVGSDEFFSSMIWQPAIITVLLFLPVFRVLRSGSNDLMPRGVPR